MTVSGNNSLDWITEMIAQAIPTKGLIACRSPPLPDTFRPVPTMFAYLGETLRRIRKDKGKTLEELGRETSLGRGQLSRIENAHQEATLSTLGKILQAQGVSRREFFRRYDLVEAEALALEQDRAPEPATAPATRGRAWPEELRAALDKVEAFFQSDADRLRPVAQGAFEVGEMVVLFRVVPRDAADAGPTDAPETAGEERPAAPRRAARKKRASGRKGAEKDSPPSPRSAS